MEILPMGVKTFTRAGSQLRGPHDKPVKHVLFWPACVYVETSKSNGK